MQNISILHRLKDYMGSHRKGLEKIAENPGLIGVHNAIDVKLEVPVYNHKGRVVTDIDVWLDTTTGVYIAEYKSGHRRRWQCALRQLNDGAEYVEAITGIMPTKLYVYGLRFRTKIVR